MRLSLSVELAHIKNFAKLVVNVKDSNHPS